MKKEGMILLVISILIISSVSLISAESNETDDNETEINNATETNETEITYTDEELAEIMPKAGITPDSVLYGVDVFFDNVRATLTPSPLGKAKVRLDIMEERMAEMEEMIGKNKTEEAKKAQLQGQKQMQKFEGSVEKIKKKDAPELNAYMQNYNARLEERKQRLVGWGEPDYADAIAEAIEMLEELENAIISLPDDLDPESTLKISLLCQEEGATTAEECEEMVAGGLLIIQHYVAPEIEGWNTTDLDPHNCSKFWSNNETKWCCYNSHGDMYSPNIEHLYRKGTVEYKIINLETEEIEGGIETDSCDGDTLTEWFCPRVMDSITQNKRYSEEYDCPYGCEDGACISG